MNTKLAIAYTIILFTVSSKVISAYEIPYLSKSKNDLLKAKDSLNQTITYIDTSVKAMSFLEEKLEVVYNFKSVFSTFDLNAKFGEKVTGWVDESLKTLLENIRNERNSYNPNL